MLLRSSLLRPSKIEPMVRVIYWVVGRATVATPRQSEGNADACEVEVPTRSAGEFVALMKARACASRIVEHRQRIMPGYSEEIGEGEEETEGQTRMR